MKTIRRLNRRRFLQAAVATAASPLFCLTILSISEGTKQTGQLLEGIVRVMGDGTWKCSFRGLINS
jgi:hypothetical protein